MFLKRDGKEERLEGNRALLEAGNYWFVARAEGYTPRELSHTVGEGSPATVELAMTRLPAAVSTPPVAKLLGIECLKDPVVGCGPFPGRLEFTAKLRKNLLLASKTFEWQLETKSAGRQTFRLEKGKLSFGKERRSHNAPLEDEVTVSCDVQARIVHCRLNRSVTITIPSDVDLTGSRLVPGDFKSLSVAPMAR